MQQMSRRSMLAGSGTALTVWMLTLSTPRLKKKLLSTSANRSWNVPPAATRLVMLNE